MIWFILSYFQSHERTQISQICDHVTTTTRRLSTTQCLGTPLDRYCVTFTFGRVTSFKSLYQFSRRFPLSGV